MKIFFIIIVSLLVGFSLGFRMKKRKMKKRIQELELQITLYKVTQQKDFYREREKIKETMQEEL